MHTPSQSGPPLQRVPTRIAGLDTVLQGGFLRGGLYVIMGPPGAGKTVLGNQLVFNHVAGGGRAIYLGLLSETHTQMFSHLQSMAFFNPSPIGKTLYYFSGYEVLEREGLTGLLALLRQVIHEQEPTMLVIDGFVTAEAGAQSTLEIKKFLNDLQAFLDAAGCTAFLLTYSPLDSRSDLTYTVVDGMLTLGRRMVGPRMVRELRVEKFRGSDFLQGDHTLQITQAGIVVHPRTETLTIPPPVAIDPTARLSFGIAELDRMLSGGLLAASTTILLGVLGSGKTALGLHFLYEGAREGQGGLYFGFNETPRELIESADKLGLDFEGQRASGMLEVVWQPPLEGILDSLAERLLNAVDRRSVRRLFIDGYAGFREAAEGYPERFSRFFIALGRQLSARGVTTVFAVELNTLLGPQVELPGNGAEVIADTIIFLRYVELRTQLYRLISILKMRRSAYDSAIREFRISADGIAVANTFDSAEAILTGTAHPAPSNTPSSASGKRTARKRSSRAGRRS